MSTLNDAWLDEFERFGPVSRTLSYLIRPALVAPEGKMLVWADWSAIEARVLPWLAGSRGGEKVLDIFRANDTDASAPDIYMIEAANIYGMDPLDVPRKGDERQIGKVAVLSLGFGGSIGALLAMATGYGIYMSETQALDIVHKWRGNNPWARNFWDQLWEAALTAINEPGTIRTAGRVAYTYDPGYLGGSLFCALPCGRLLTYPTIRWEDRDVEDKKTGVVSSKRQLTYRRGYGRAALWYGKLCLAGDTLVGTDRGWVRLDQVRKTDMVWDGVEYVAHDGLVWQGNKPTIPTNGVHMTPDHEVLCNGGWKKAKDIEGPEWAPVRLPDGLAAGAATRPRKAQPVVRPMRLRDRIAMLVGGVASKEPTPEPAIVRVPAPGSYSKSATNSRHEQAPGLRRLALYAGSVSPAFTSGVAQLRRTRNFGMRAMEVLRELLGRHGSYVSERAYAGAPGQRWQLQPAELLLGDVYRTSQEPSQIATCLHGGYSERDRHTKVNPLLSLVPEPVYDLINAGPRSRFVVMGNDGPMIVHNCENVTQATAGSILRGKLVTLRQLEDWMPVVAHTHDEIVTETDAAPAVVQRATDTLMQIMTTNEDWNAGLPLAAEASVLDFYSKAA